MKNIYDLYRYHELKKRLEKIEERLNNDWFISEYVSHTLEKEKEENIKGDLTADILKVGHHGSTTSTSEKFLKKVMPQIALISVGEDNSYGHPNQKVLDRLKKYNVKVYRTDIDGEIKLKIKNNGKISLNVMNKKRETN